MAVLLAWVSWDSDAPDPGDWEPMLKRAAARSRFSGRLLAAPGLRLFAARTRAAAPDPIHIDNGEWLAIDSTLSTGSLGVLGLSPAIEQPCAAIRIDPAQRRVVLSLDVLGQRRLAYASVPGCLIVASGEHILLAHRCVQPTRDDEYLAAFVTQLPSAPEATPFSGVRQLRPGETRTWQDGKSVAAVRPLLPDQSWQRLSESEMVAEYRKRMLTAVERTVAGSGRIAVSLSGGMDSAVIAGCLKMSEATHAVAVTYGFADWPQIDERSLAGEICAATGLEHITFTADHLFPLSSTGSRPTCPDVPYSSPFREIKEATYAALHQTGADVWLSGDFGDHLSADPSDWLGDAIHYRRFAAAFRRLSWNLRERGLLAGVWQDRGIRRAARSVFKRPHWPGLRFLRAEHREALRRRLDSELQALSCFPRPLQAFHVLNARAAYSAAGESWFADRHGMENRLPFRDPHLTRWMLSLPVDLSFRDGTWKWIVRRAFASQLPQTISNRPKLSDLTPFVDAACAAQAREWAALATEGRSLIEHLLDDDAIAKADSDDAWDLRWAFISVALWARAQ